MTFNSYSDFLRQKALCSNIDCNRNTLIPIRNYANVSIFNRYRNLFSRINNTEILYEDIEAELEPEPEPEPVND